MGVDGDGDAYGRVLGVFGFFGEVVFVQSRDRDCGKRNEDYVEGEHVVFCLERLIQMVP